MSFVYGAAHVPPETPSLRPLGGRVARRGRAGAAHVPAIWATQVLDTLARTGVPSRAEVTDAAASVAAECVMLNKGPFVEEAVRVLSDILRRMEKHRYKKRSLYRKLRVSSFG